MKRAFGLLAFLTLLSRFSGFIRVAVFAAFFGRGPESDVFLTALLVPELMYRLLSEGLVASAAIPLFVRHRGEADRERTSFWSIFWIVSAAAAMAVAGLMVWAKPLCALLVPGFPADRLDTLARLWRLIAPYVLLSAQTAVMTAFLNARQVFGPPGLGPLLVNLTIIGAILGTGGGNLEAIALSVTLGAVLQMAWLTWLVRGHGVVLDQAFDRRHLSGPLMREFADKVAPVALWLFLTPIIPVYERYLLSSEAVGSVTLLNYNEKLLNLPLGIISISLATVLFPNLSEIRDEERPRLLRRGIWALTAMLLPIFLTIQTGSETIVATVYQRGRFELAETGLTAAFFRAYAWWLLPTSICLLLNRALFAGGSFRFPFIAGLASIILQIGLDTWMVPRWGPPSVGWGAAGAANVQMFLLFAGLWWSGGPGGWGRALVPAVAGLLAGLLATGPLVTAFPALAGWTGCSDKWALLALLVGWWGLLQVGVALLAWPFWRANPTPATTTSPGARPPAGEVP